MSIEDRSEDDDWDGPDDKIARANLIKFREEAGLTQAQLAQMVGVAVININLYENGKRGIPKPSTLKKITNVFGRMMDDVYERNPLPLAQAVIRPFALRVLPDVEIPRDLSRKAWDAIDDLNREYRRRKESGQLAKKDGGDGAE